MYKALFLLCLSATLVIQDDESLVDNTPTQARSEAKGARLRATASRLEARLARPFNAKRLESALDIAAQQIAEANGEVEVQYESSSLLVRELQSFRTWNLPTLGGAVKETPLDFKDPSNPLHIIVQHAAELEAHGIDFLVVPVPTRLDIYSERLPGIASKDAYRGGNRGMMKFLLELTHNGVEIVDLYEAFERDRDAASSDKASELYLAHNSHWTPRASLLAADAIASKIVDRKGYVPGELKLGVDFVVREERRVWGLEQASGEHSLEFLFHRVLRPDGTRAFGADRTSDVLLLGDSFALHYQKEDADLASQLFARLKRPLDLIALRGGALSRTWQAVVRRQDQLAGKRLVVWELTSGALTNPKMSMVRVFED